MMALSAPATRIFFMEFKAIPAFWWSATHYDSFGFCTLAQR